MKTSKIKEHTSCKHYHYEVGFKIAKPLKGDRYENKKFIYQSIVFVLDGEIEFSYDDYMKK